VWEWRGEMMHAKTNVIDSRWVRIGSTDFNLLGIAINYELDAFIEDAALGRQAEEMFLEDLESSREIFIRRSHVVAGPDRSPAPQLPAPVQQPGSLVPTRDPPRLRFPQEDSQ
jgi:phosphatidylserine/phosphatidylglycerophosphate/cardiolipin synthase-like enzyme